MRKHLLKNGTQIVEERFFERRGSFGKNKYFYMMPEKLCEWVVVMCMSDYKSVNLSRFSNDMSILYKKYRS